MRSNEISRGKKGILKGKKPNLLNSGLAPPIKMQINKAEDYRNQGPLIYEDPNSMGPKDRYILVRTNMFDNRGIHPQLLQKYIEESLKKEDNLKLLKSLMQDSNRKRRSKSPRYSVQQYVDTMNSITLKMIKKVHQRSHSRSVDQGFKLPEINPMKDSKSIDATKTHFHVIRDLNEERWTGMRRIDSATKSVQAHDTFTRNTDLFDKDSLMDVDTLRTGFETADGTLAHGKRRWRKSSHAKMGLRKSGENLHMKSVRTSESPEGRASARRCSVCSLKDL